MPRQRAQRAHSLRSGLRKNAHLDVTSDGSHEVAVVEIADLKVDITYQREANQRRVDLISRDYDMSKAGVIEVSRRDNGEMYVVDGRHRMLAAHISGETELLAHIHVGLTQQQEARLFREMNKTRLPIKALEEFKAGMVAGDEALIEIEAIVRGLGGHIANTVGDGGGIVAVKSLEGVHRQHGGAGLTRSLSLIRDAYGHLDREHAQASLIKAFSAFAERYSEAGVNPEYKRPRLVKRLREVGLLTLIQQGEMMQNIYRGAQWINIARAMVPIYNAGLAEASRLAPFDRAT